MEKNTHFNVAVIGQGPAGLTSALYTARSGLSTVVFERMGPGGQMTETEHLDNYRDSPKASLRSIWLSP